MLIEEQEPGVWHIRTASVIPDNERWLHTSQASADLAKALAYARAHPPGDESVDDVLDRLNG